MSARSVVSAAVGSASLFCATLPEATPTTLPTAVTAVADATANPRTEIRLTRFPSSIARLGDLADAIVPLTLIPPCSGPEGTSWDRLATGDTGPVRTPAGVVAWCSGGV